MPGIHQGGPPPGQIPFGTLGKLSQEQGAHRKGQDGIPQELQTFIAGAALRVFMRIRTVAQGLIQQLQVLETMAQPLRQAFQFLPALWEQADFFP